MYLKAQVTVRADPHSLIDTVLLDHISTTSSTFDGLTILMSYIAQNPAGIFIHSRWSDCPEPDTDQEASETEWETSTIINHRRESSNSSSFNQKDMNFTTSHQFSDAQQACFHSELSLILQLTWYM